MSAAYKYAWCRSSVQLIKLRRMSGGSLLIAESNWVEKVLLGAVVSCNRCELFQTCQVAEAIAKTKPLRVSGL